MRALLCSCRHKSSFSLECLSATKRLLIIVLGMLKACVTPWFSSIFTMALAHFWVVRLCHFYPIIMNGFTGQNGNDVAVKLNFKNPNELNFG